MEDVQKPKGIRSSECRECKRSRGTRNSEWRVCMARRLALATAIDAGEREALAGVGRKKRWQERGVADADGARDFCPLW